MHTTVLTLAGYMVIQWIAYQWCQILVEADPSFMSNVELFSSIMLFAAGTAGVIEKSLKSLCLTGLYFWKLLFKRGSRMTTHTSTKRPFERVVS